MARARIETTAFARAGDLRRHRLQLAGLWARITRSARSATSRFVSSASPPSSSASARGAAGAGVAAQHGLAPAAGERRAMLPEPMKPTCMAGEYRGRRPRVAGAGHQGASAHANVRAGLRPWNVPSGMPDRAAVDLGAGRAARRGARAAPALPVSVIARLRGLGRAARGRVRRLDRVAAGLHALGELELVGRGAGDDRGAAARDDRARRGPARAGRARRRSRSARRGSPSPCAASLRGALEGELRGASAPRRRGVRRRRAAARRGRRRPASSCRRPASSCRRPASSSPPSGVVVPPPAGRGTVITFVAVPPRCRRCRPPRA